MLKFPKFCKSQNPKVWTNKYGASYLDITLFFKKRSSLSAVVQMHDNGLVHDERCTKSAKLVQVHNQRNMHLGGGDYPDIQKLSHRNNIGEIQ